jgi:ferric-dicitrate binding protein FerR (iron transport regulator)
MLAAFVLVLAATLSAGACARKPADGAAERSAPPSAEVAYIQGEVLINGAVPEFGDRLGTEFSVKTGPGARCDIVFGGGNALSVGQNAVAIFDFSRSIVAVRVERGGLSSVLRKLEQLVGEDSFVVRTANASAGVRGTSFCVWVDETSTYVCACNGRVRTLDSAGSQEETLEAAHHAARLYTRLGSSISKEAAGMLHHDDASIQSVADRIGYVIDWNALDG